MRTRTLTALLALTMVGAIVALGAAQAGSSSVDSGRPAAAVVKGGVVPGSSTAFMFEGILAQPDGTYNFKFSLYDAPTKGDLVAGPVTVKAVGVVSSEYSTEIDFGSDPFTGAARFVQVAWVASGGGAYTSLATRVELVAAPYALGLRLPATLSTAIPGTALSVTNSGTGTGNAISGTTSNGSSGDGVFGSTTGGAVGEGGGGGSGVYGQSLGSGPGTSGQSSLGYGVDGTTVTGTAGVYGTSMANGSGVEGQVNGTGAGVYGENDGPGAAVSGYSATGTAGSFTGGGTNTALSLDAGGIQVVGAGTATATPVFIQRVTPTNQCDSGHATIIDNPFLNGNPDAIVFTANGNAYPVDAIYISTAANGCPAGQWILLFADSGDSMLVNEYWPVLVITS